MKSVNNVHFKKYSKLMLLFYTLKFSINIHQFETFAINLDKTRLFGQSVCLFLIK